MYSTPNHDSGPRSEAGTGDATTKSCVWANRGCAFRTPPFRISILVGHWRTGNGGKFMRSYSPILLACLVPLSAATASDGDTLKQFGMVGHLAVDCNSHHSGSNPHFWFSISTLGKVAYTVRQGRGREYHMLSHPRLLARELLQYESEDFTVTWTKIDRKFRLWRMVRADGRIYVADGKTIPITPQAHEPTQALMTCGT